MCGVCGENSRALRSASTAISATAARSGQKENGRDQPAAPRGYALCYHSLFVIRAVTQAVTSLSNNNNS
jgi:hypothetical protein